MRARGARTLPALALAALGLLALAAGGHGAGSRLERGPQAAAPQLSRIISARVHHTRISTVRNTNARRIGRALAVLRPTWVTSMIRYAKGQHPTHAEIRSWREITRIVHTAAPQAQFDVTLNAKQYRDGKEIQRMMSRVRSDLTPNGWFFDFFSTAYRKRPRMIRAAIASAHAHGEWIGGNVFGIAKRRRPLPVRADFVAVQDFHHLTLNLPAIRRVAAKVPVVYHLNNDPDNQRSGGCRFIEQFNSAERRTFVRHRARQQARNFFRVSYPVLFPECRRHGRRNGGFLYSYNAFRDPPMPQTILKLLDRYD